MKLALGFRHKLAANLDVVEGKYSLFPVRQQFDQIKSRIAAGWNIDHLPNGHHGDVVAETVTCEDVELNENGLAFPATQNASSNVNTLDDYEEGSWTPTITGSGGATGTTYSGQVGRYIKVGKLVWVSCKITLTAAGTITGNVRIGGLPFTVANITDLEPPGVISWTGLATNWVDIVATAQPNTTQAQLSGATAAAASNSTALLDADIGDTSVIWMTLTYQASN